MTGRRVLKQSAAAQAGGLAVDIKIEPHPPAGTVDANGRPGPPAPEIVTSRAVDTVTLNVKPGDVIARLLEVVDHLRTIEQLNAKLQAQYAVGSATWSTCETLDDRLHDIYMLLGE